MEKFTLALVALLSALAPSTATGSMSAGGVEAASVVPETAPARIDPPDSLMDSSYSGFTCNTGLSVLGYPLQPTASPVLSMTYPGSVQHYQPFTFRTSLDRPNPASYAMGGGLTQTIHRVFNLGLRLPLPLGAAQTGITLDGGSWNAAWGSAPSLTNSNSYVQAANGSGDAGVPGGNPATIDLPSVDRQLVAVGNAGSTIDITLPGSGDLNTATFFFQQRFTITGPVGIPNTIHAVRCLPGGGGGNTVLATISIVPLQPQLALTASPTTVVAGAPLTLNIAQSSVAGLLNGGIVTFERVGGATVGTATLAVGVASLVIPAPTTIGNVSYRARWTSNGNANIADATSNTLVIPVSPAPVSALSVVSGSPQGVAPGESFAPLVVRARDPYNNPISGAIVTFTAPSSGASAVLSSSTATTDTTGEARINATANTIGGSYAVIAAIGSVRTTFNLSNIVPASVSASIASSGNPSTIPGAAPGGNVSFAVTLTSTGILQGPVQLAVAGLPVGATASFAGNNLTPPASTTLTIQTTAATPLGTHPFTLSATSGSLGDTATTGFHMTRALPGAGVISIDFGNGPPMMPTETAGVVIRPNWIPANGTDGASTTVFDETGTTTPVAFEWVASGVFSIAYPDSPGDYRMMSHYLDTNNTQATSIAVDGLPDHAGGYLVYVYVDGDNIDLNAARTGRYRVAGDVAGDTTIDIVDLPTAPFTGSFVRALNGPGNYAVFPIKGTGFTLTATPMQSTDQFQRAPVNAIQIVPADLLFFDGFD